MSKTTLEEDLLKEYEQRGWTWTKYDTILYQAIDIIIIAAIVLVLNYFFHFF